MIDRERLETCSTYAAQMRDTLRAALEPRQANHLDAAALSGRESELLNAKWTWTAFRARNETWTQHMQDYWQCLITLHYGRAGTPSPIDPSASMTRSGWQSGSFYDVMAERGD